MERRKLLISIGALGAGGAAAFGTEAFTSIEAERNVDVSVAGDSSAYLAFQALDSENANNYVTTESDDTIALELDGDGGAGGSGVNQDAVTQIEDLFKIVNQGTQPTSVYFEDDSDAVTFRVTRSTNTSTSGSNGQSLEGADNSVELDVGEQVVVGLTVDTLNNDASGSLIDTVTVYADAGAAAPQQNVPQPQYVIDGTGDKPNTFAKLSDALRSGTIEPGAVVGIEGGQVIDESGENVNSDGSSEDRIDIETSDITITGFGSGTAQIDLSSRQTLKAVANGITLRNLKVTEPGSAGRTIDLAGSNVTADGLIVTSSSVTAGPHIQTNGDDTTISNCDVRNGAIAASGASGTLNLTGNSIDTAPAEGIFGFSNDSALDVEAKNNIVKNHDTQDAGAKEIKFNTPPATINGESATQAQLEALLADNTILTAEVGGSVGTKVTSQSNPSGSTLEAAINEAGNGGLTLVESGDFNEKVNIDEDNFALRGPNADRTRNSSRGTEATIVAPSGSRAINITGAGVEVSGFRAEGDGGGVIVVSGDGDNLEGEVTITNNVIRADSSSSLTNGVLISDASSPGGPKDATIAGNDIKSGEGAAVNVFNGSTHGTVTVTNNKLSGDPGGLRGITDLTVENNDIYPLGGTNDKALDVSGIANSASITDNVFSGEDGERAYNDDDLGDSSPGVSTVQSNNSFDPGSKLVDTSDDGVANDDEIWFSSS